jgi:hypothetical protein
MRALQRVPRAHLLVAGIVGLAVAFRSWGLAWGLDNASISRRPHPDEWPVYWLFRWFDAGHSLNPCPASTRCFFDWGSVYPSLAYGLHFLLGPLWTSITPDWGRTPQLFFIHAALTGRLVSVAASALTVIVVYRLGSYAYGQLAGVVGALVLALCTLAIQLAHFATPDSVVGLLLSLALLCLLVSAERPSHLRFALAGALVGIATGAEYHMALLAAPLVVASLLARPRTRSRLAVSALAAIAAYLVTNPYAVIDAHAFVAAQIHTLRIRTVDSGIQYQGRFDRYGPDILYVLRYPLGYGVGFPLAIWMTVSAIQAAWRRQRADLILLAWLIPYALLITLSPAKFIRYGAPLLPPLAVLSGRAMKDLWTVAPRRLRTVGVPLLAAGLIWTAVYDSAYAGLFSAPDPRFVAAQWLRAHVGQGQQVGLESLPTGLINVPYFVANAGYRPCFLQFQPARLSGPMNYVVTDDYSLEEHPGSSTGQVLAFLHSLQSSPSYRLVFRSAKAPTFLGLTFPIASSPHDWRYPGRVISIYRRTADPPGAPALCFSSVRAATTALKSSFDSG